MTVSISYPKVVKSMPRSAEMQVNNLSNTFLLICSVLIQGLTGNIAAFPIPVAERPQHIDFYALLFWQVLHLGSSYS